jgi:hypothetical protein
MSIKDLVGKSITKKEKFMGTDVVIKKLLLSEATEIQEIAKRTEADENSDELELLRYVVRKAVENGQDLTDEDFMEFPIEELSTLVEKIMAYSGIGDKKSGK